MSRVCSAMVKGRRAGLEMAENAKPKRNRTKTAVKHGPHKCSSLSTYHSFLDAADVILLRSQLLSWYDNEKRELPWRTTKTNRILQKQTLCDSGTKNFCLTGRNLEQTTTLGVKSSQEHFFARAMTEPDVNIRTYAVWVTLMMSIVNDSIQIFLKWKPGTKVWVSEIMLQQTQVTTVKDYYNKWMKRWPTVQDLAAATLEEVNQMWAGLGYYSRGKRLHEGAQKVVSELKGQMPQTVDSLLKQLPGVGRYTAAAIGSIALGQVTGAVDGNVIRVLCRLRAIGADSTSPAVTEALWDLANTLVDPERPGDFNQAMMELGARVCTPKAPLCSQCPIRTHCRSYQKVNAKQEQNSKKLLGKMGKKPLIVPDIEDCGNTETCSLCPSEPWDDELGVLNFPRKPAKKPPRLERTLSCVVIRRREEGEDEYLLTQRPDRGLLAGLWEFPSLLLDGENSEMKQKKLLCSEISRILGTRLTESLFQSVGEVVHIFSHIHQTYIVYSVCLKDGNTQTNTDNTQWLSRSALQEAAVSTGMKKILKLSDSVDSQRQQPSTDGKRKNPLDIKTTKKVKKPRLGGINGGGKQLSLSSFFTSVKEEP